MPEMERGGNDTNTDKVDLVLEKMVKYVPTSMIGGLFGLSRMNLLRADVSNEAIKISRAGGGVDLAYEFYKANWYWEPIGFLLGVAGGILATKYISSLLKKYMKTPLNVNNSESIYEEDKNTFMSRCGVALGFGMSSPLPSIASMAYSANPEKAAGLADILSRYGGSLFENLGINTGIHEYSHYIPAEILYTYTQKNSFGEPIFRHIPTVHVGRWAEFNRQLFKEGWIKAIGDLLSGNGERGGYFSDCPTGLSDIGSILGERNSSLLIVAAGTMGELATGLSLYLVGRKIKRKAPVEGGLLQAISIGMNLKAIAYPVNTALLHLRNETYQGDWSYISEVTGIDPAIFAAAISTVYPAMVAGLYLYDRKKRKDKERREAAYRLISNDTIKKEDMNSIISDYIHKPRSRLSKAIPFGKRRRKKQFLRYGITKFDDFERCEKNIMEKLQDNSVMRKFRIKRSINALRKLRDYVVDDVARSDGFKDLVGMERKLYHELSSKYFGFGKNPEKCLRELQKKLNIDDDQNVLKERLERFYDGEGVAALTVYGQKICRENILE